MLDLTLHADRRSEAAEKEPTAFGDIRDVRADERGSLRAKAPAVVRDLGALPEVVQDSGVGFVYRTDEELLSALNRLAASPALRAELGERGYPGFLRT